MNFQELFKGIYQLTACKGEPHGGRSGRTRGEVERVMILGGQRCWKYL
jgi:hypothetical protein